MIERIPGHEAVELMALFEEIGEVVFPDVSEISAVSRHVKDDYLLASAVLGEADYLVTGDKDLLVLGGVEGLKIVSPTEFLGVLQEES